MRRVTSLLAIVLVFVAVNCFSTCLVAQTAPMVPPCHQHHQQQRHQQDQQAPCENHPGQLAFSAAQASTHLDFVLPAVTGPVFVLAVGLRVVDIAPPQVPVLPRPPLLSLRI